MIKIEFFRVVIEINNILAEWDPNGSQLVDSRWPHSEYIDYIPKIIGAYISGIDLFDFLIDLKLIIDSNEENIISTKKAANQIKFLFSIIDKQQLEIMFNN